MLNFKQQVIIALIGSTKAWMPEAGGLQEAAKVVGIETPTTFEGSVKLAQKYFAKMLSEYADEICKESEGV